MILFFMINYNHARKGPKLLSIRDKTTNEKQLKRCLNLTLTARGSIMTSKVDPRTDILKIYIMAVDP